MGYAYKLGMPIEIGNGSSFPVSRCCSGSSFRSTCGRITTMPEYLERRFGPSCAPLYALLRVRSYVFVNFALVFYTGGFALDAMRGIDRPPRCG